MKNLKETIESFLLLTSTFSGAQPTFRINYDKKHIEIVEACSGFLHRCYSDPKNMMHLVDGVITFEVFN